MIIDCHCHAGTAETMTAPWNTVATLARHLERARAAGIDQTVVFPISSLDYERANEEVAEIVAKNSKELIGFARVHPVRDKGRIGQLLERAVYDFKMRGLKIHASEAFPTREVCEVAEALRLPLLIDTADNSLPVDMCAREFPNLNIIVAHLGSWSNNYNVLFRTIDQIEHYPNVYVDISGIRMYDFLEEAVLRAGADKILFGSDGPLLHPGIELQKVLHLNLPPQDQAKITSGNLLRLLPNS